MACSYSPSAYQPPSRRSSHQDTHLHIVSIQCFSLYPSAATTSSTFSHLEWTSRGRTAFFLLDRLLISLFLFATGFRTIPHDLFSIFSCFERADRQIGGLGLAGWLLTTTMDGVMGLWGNCDFLFLGWDGIRWAMDGWAINSNFLVRSTGMICTKCCCSCLPFLALVLRYLCCYWAFSGFGCSVIPGASWSDGSRALLPLLLL